MKKRIDLDYHPCIIKILKDNDIKLDIVEYCSSRGED